MNKIEILGKLYQNKLDRMLIHRDQNRLEHALSILAIEELENILDEIELFEEYNIACIVELCRTGK